MSADQTNLPATTTPAEQEALAMWLPSTGFIFPLKDGQHTTVFNPSLWASICHRYANGETAEIICKEYRIPRAIIWGWATMPELADHWKEARKYHSHAILDDAVQALKDMQTGKWMIGMADPTGKAAHARSRAMADAIKLSMEMAAKLNPDDYSERLQIDKKPSTVIYVVGLSPSQEIGTETRVIDVPAPDKAGHNRAELPHTWRQELSRERRRKRESSG